MSEFIWDGVTAIATIAATGVAWWQLSGLKSTLKYNSLMAVLEMEAEMHRRKEKFDDVNTKIGHAALAGTPNAALAAVLEQEKECALEGYLNSIDRLAYCILKEYLKDKDWKKEYDNLIRETIEENESKFGAATRYTHIVDLHAKWSRH